MGLGVGGTYAGSGLAPSNETGLEEPSANHFVDPTSEHALGSWDVRWWLR